MATFFVTNRMKTVKFNISVDNPVRNKRTEAQLGETKYILIEDSHKRTSIELTPKVIGSFGVNRPYIKLQNIPKNSKVTLTGQWDALATCSYGGQNNQNKDVILFHIEKCTSFTIRIDNIKMDEKEQPNVTIGDDQGGI